MPLDLKMLDSLLNKGYTYAGIAKKLNCSVWEIMEHCRQYGIRSKAGTNYTPDQLEKISKAKHLILERPNEPNVLNTIAKDTLADIVKVHWAKQMCQDRVNGLAGIIKKDKVYTPRTDLIFKESNPKNYKCSVCGETINSSDYMNSILFIDRNSRNTLLSNLLPVCEKCQHGVYNINFVAPLTEVTSTFKFDAAHYLPNHSRKCKFLHGHSYKLQVTVRRPVNPTTGMVIDFGELKEAVKLHIEEPFDHAYINNFIPMPTSENIIMWIWEQLSMDIRGISKLRLYETENNYSTLSIYDVQKFIQDNQNWVQFDDKKVLNDYKRKIEAIQNIRKGV